MPTVINDIAYASFIRYIADIAVHNFQIPFNAAPLSSLSFS